MKITWSLPREQHLKWLARGIVNMTLVIAAGGEKMDLVGRIGIKFLCNTLYAILSGQSATKPTITGASGYASLVLQPNGQLHYKIDVVGLMQPILEITFDVRKRLVKKIARHVTPRDKSRAMVSGIWQRPSVVEICAMYSGVLSVNVRTGLYRRGELKGFAKQMTYAGHQAPFSDFPFILSGNEVIPSTRTGATGLIWASLDRHCSLHYHILLEGLARSRRRNNLLTADLEGFAFPGELPLSYKKKTNALKSFSGAMTSGVHRGLDTEFLVNMVRGRVYLQISSVDNPRGELRGQLKVAPGQCKLPQTTHIEPEGTCQSEGRSYFDGEKWYPDYDKKCTTCSCTNKKVSCKPIVCSAKNCSEALVTLSDICCPVCPALESQTVLSYPSNAQKGCSVDNGRKFYLSKSVWHPLIEPFGHMRCVVCTCLASNNEIKCSRIQCPKLTCPFPVKKHPSNCCFQCPDKKKNQDQKKVCRFGNRKYPSGSTWSPYLPTIGLLKCVTCRCQDGDANCASVQCPEKLCKARLSQQHKGCCVQCP